MHSVQCVICGSEFQTSNSVKKTCSDNCANKLGYLRKKKCDLIHKEQRKIARDKRENNNPDYKTKRQDYFATHIKASGVYDGKVICPKCGQEGYRYIMKSVLTSNAGKQTSYVYVTVSHRHTINGKSVTDKTCSIGKLNNSLNKSLEKT